MNWRAYFITVIVLLTLLVVIVQAAKLIWPAPTPMLIDAAYRAPANGLVQWCSPPRPLRRNFKERSMT